MTRTRLVHVTETGLNLTGVLCLSFVHLAAQPHDLFTRRSEGVDGFNPALKKCESVKVCDDAMVILLFHPEKTALLNQIEYGVSVVPM